MAASGFFGIETLPYPGYSLTQGGKQLVLAATDTDNPFQLWYKDDSWQFLADATQNPLFVLINHGSKKALKGVGPALTKVLLVPYDPSVKDDTLLWAFSLGTFSQAARNEEESVNLTLDLGVGKEEPVCKDEIAIIVNQVGDAARHQTQSWKFNAYVPRRYRIQALWNTQKLTYKHPHQDATYIDADGLMNDELTVVAVSSKNDKGNLEVWLRVPAGGQEDSNSCFIIINQGTGRALKGSAKPGDKVIATKYDPLDYDFVWSEDRSVKSTSTHVAVSSSTSPDLQWYLPREDEYQNSEYYHPLTVVKLSSSRSGDRDNKRLWQFIAVKD